MAKKRKRYDSRHSQSCLLKAALEIFSRHGYEGASTRAIARKAGLNDSLIQRYFKSKSGLFSALIKQHHSDLAEDLPYPPSATLEEEFANFFRQRIQFAKKRKKFLRLILIRASSDSGVRAMMSGFSRQGMTGLIRRLEQLRDEGRVRADLNPVDASRILSGIGFSMVLLSEVLACVDRGYAERLIPVTAKVLARGFAP